MRSRRWGESPVSSGLPGSSSPAQATDQAARAAAHASAPIKAFIAFLPSFGCVNLEAPVRMVHKRSRARSRKKLYGVQQSAGSAARGRYGDTLGRLSTGKE